MRSRRFLLLATILVTLNVALWLASGALGLSQGTFSSLFGRSMMRVDVTENNGVEWRLDRGIVISNVGGVLTLREADTKTQVIDVSSTTKVNPGTTGTAVKIGGIKPGWRVVVQWPALGGPAQTVLIETRARPAS